MGGTRACVRTSNPSPSQRLLTEIGEEAVLKDTPRQRDGAQALVAAHPAADVEDHRRDGGVQARAGSRRGRLAPTGELVQQRLEERGQPDDPDTGLSPAAAPPKLV